MAPLIYPNDRADAQALARQLLDAAGEERHDEVRTTSDGPIGLAFDVPEDLAREVVDGYDVVDLREEGDVETPGLTRGPEPEPEPEPTSEPESKPAAGAGEESKSADAGADVSEADAEAEGASQPPPKASRSRSSRSR
ncbi:hypothetical protein [Micromonospora cathayae]|uniref:Uncharacterized protein n=1 Tax=Micromonospora cathayae TaxID=3028804 RepID=A0ABY7ZLX9_9ACTN|nr:hypothetical protein [Micromonospora sp. HUAS 3]WDZ84022.1 hypothetical protein PVK37_26700 [Micromonospora sp. HUAS 3]